jgi:hypothetical protein
MPKSLRHLVVIFFGTATMALDSQDNMEKASNEDGTATMALDSQDNMEKASNEDGT